MDVSERKRVAQWVSQMDEPEFRQMEAIMEAAKVTRIEAGTLSEVAEISRAVRARYPDAEMIRVAVDEGEDTWCMAVGFYGVNGARLALEDYDMHPHRPRTCQRQVEQAWDEGGKDVWPDVEGADVEDYPGDVEVREIRLPLG